MWNGKFKFEKSRIILGDCLEKMSSLKDKSVDFILADLPYGLTNNKLDVTIPFAPLWEQYERVIKDDGAIALYAQGIFYVDLVNSNRKLFKYDIVWDKQLTTGFLNANKRPLRSHEQIAIFYKKQPTYNPQFEKGKPLHSKGFSYKEKGHKNQNYGEFHMTDDSRAGNTDKYPKSIISFQKPHPSKSLHRNEKSVECNEWLINTFTNEGELVLDNVSGSGTTAESCINTNRDFIIIEKNPVDYEIGKNRVKKLFDEYNLNFNSLLM